MDSRATYGEYQVKSVPVYSAIQIRSGAVARPPLRVYIEQVQDGDGERERVGRDHPLQMLLNKVNPFWTRGDLWRATETYLALWGSAYWTLSERDPEGRPTEIWPLRPDRMRIIPDAKDYIRGYVYAGANQQLIPFLPDDVVRIRYFNTINEYAGLSPIAPLRLPADMGVDALRSELIYLTMQGRDSDMVRLTWVSQIS